MKPSEALYHYINTSISAFARLANDATIAESFDNAVRLCVSAYANRSKILVAGNGGSAADAQHFAGELVSRFCCDRPALAAIALTTDTSVLTSIGNDFSFDLIFARQIQAFGVAGDVFIAISTSGNSPNILKALEQARKQGLATIGLAGLTGGKLKTLCDICLCAPSDSVPHIQECHLVLEHTLCACIEEELFGSLTSL